MATASETIAIYNAVLQRNPTDAELASFVANSQTSSAQSQQIDLLVNSSEANSTVDPVVRVYQATFGRVPDKAGLDFWTDFYRDSGDVGKPGATPALTTLNQGFVNSDEFKARFPTAAANGTVTEDFLNALYQQTLGRAPDQAGKDFYLGKSIASTVTAFAQSSEFINLSNSQVNLFLNKAGNMTQDYAGSVFDTNDDGKVDGADSAPPPNPGQTFTLTDSTTTGTADNITGTSGDDTFRAPLIGGNNSLETVDTINGNGGNDTINATVKDTTTVAPVLQSVENVFVAPEDAGTRTATFDGSAATGLNAVWHTNVGMTAGSASVLNVQGVSTGVTVGVKDTLSASTEVQTTNVTFTGVSGANDTAKIVVDGTDTGSSVNANGIEHFNVTAMSGSTIELDTTAANVGESITATGAGNLTLTAGANLDDQLALVDASTMTGSLNFTDTLNVNATVKSGSGADTVGLTAGVATNVFTVDTGAGNDTVNMSATQEHKITIGAGQDTVNLTTSGTGGNLAAGDIVTSAGLISAAVKIMDFSSVDDTLNIDSFAGNEFVLTGTQLSDVADEANLMAAINKAVSFGGWTDGDTVGFQFGGNSYVFVDDVADGAITASDSLVQLIGVGSLTTDDVVVS